MEFNEYATSDYLRGLKDGRAEAERLTLKLDEAHDYIDGLFKLRNRLQDELVQVKGELNELKCEVGHILTKHGYLESAEIDRLKGEINSEAIRWHTSVEELKQEKAGLKLLAESYRSILAGLINSSDRGDTGSDSSYSRYWAEARQALEDGK